MMIWILCIVLAVLLICVIISIAAALNEPEDTHAQKVERIKAKHQETIREIDRTADYYVGLYRYIAKRLDDESRRRQSG